jgi:hypothetical protein
LYILLSEGIQCEFTISITMMRQFYFLTETVNCKKNSVILSGDRNPIFRESEGRGGAGDGGEGVEGGRGGYREGEGEGGED